MNTILLLLALAMVLFFVEIFAPGGILGFIACILIFTASIIAFKDFGVLWGCAVLFGGLTMAGLFFVFEMQFLMKSKFGRRFFAHSETQTARVGLPEEEVASLLGMTGEAITRMTPTGKIVVGAQTYPAVSLDGYLAKGTPIVIKEANPSSIKVSPIHLS